jgi:outer membrane immunogenic protein
MAAQKVASLACAMLTLSVGAAAAADLPSRKGPPIYAAPAFTWTGFYLSATHGYGGGDLDASAIRFDPGPAQAQATRLGGRYGGFFVGGQMGYDHQFANNVVLGVIADLNWSGMKAQNQTMAYTLGGAASGLGQNIDQSYGLNWYGTARVRLGYAYGKLLPYLTGGFAYGSVWFDNRDGVAFSSGVYSHGSANASGLRGGFTVGAGLEYAVNDSLSLFSEYSYLELGGLNGPLLRSFNGATGSATGGGLFSTSSFGTHLLRTGVNWRPTSVGQVVHAVSDPFGTVDSILSMYNEAPLANWTGFYGGVSGGYGGGAWKSASQYWDVTPSQYTDADTNARSGGFIVGGQFGYNRQYGRFVVGVETDINWSEVQANAWQSNASANPVAGVSALGPNLSNKTSVDWFGSTRLRLGWAAGRTLPYVTAGVAYGGLSARSPYAMATTNGQFDAIESRASTTSIGWTVGSGLDYALTDTVSLRSEYLYTSLDGISGTSAEIYRAFSVPAAAVITSSVIGKFQTRPLGTHSLRAGVNVRFGSP